MSSVANDTDVKALLHYSFRSKYVYLKQFSAKLIHSVKKKKKKSYLIWGLQGTIYS